MLNLDSTLVLQMINFLIIIFIAKRYILEPILSNIERRNEKLAYLQREIKAKEEKLAELKKIYNLKLLEARNKLNDERKLTLDNLKKSFEAQRTTEKKLNESYYREQIAILKKESEKLMNELNKKVPEFSELIIEKLL
jgi:F-type H+-transporting ATPase subunit b